MSRDIEYVAAGLVRNFKLIGFATGNYLCTCSNCREPFTGDKRARCCLKCAIKLVEEKIESNFNMFKLISDIKKIIDKEDGIYIPHYGDLYSRINAIVPQKDDNREEKIKWE